MGLLRGAMGPTGIWGQIRFSMVPNGGLQRVYSVGSIFDFHAFSSLRFGGKCPIPYGGCGFLFSNKYFGVTGSRASRKNGRGCITDFPVRIEA